MITLPKDSDRAVHKELGYFESHDAIAKKDYAYLAFTETNPDTGKWYLQIKATCTAHTKLDPDHPSVRTNMSKAAVEGKDYIIFGFNFPTKDDDPRLVENRLYFDNDLAPIRVVMDLQTRNEDGSPTDKQTIEFNWPGEPKGPEQLLALPKSNDRKEYIQLAYLNSYDVMVDKDYAYLAYQEKDVASGKWVLRITAKCTAGGMVDPAHPSFVNNVNAAKDKGDDYWVFGFNLVSKDDDPRLVENRLFYDGDGNPTKVEIHVITRNGDGSAKPELVEAFDWPS